MMFKDFINEAIYVYYQPTDETPITGERWAIVEADGKKYKINRDQFARIEACRNPDGTYTPHMWRHVRPITPKKKKVDNQLKLFKS